MYFFFGIHSGPSGRSAGAWSPTAAGLDAAEGAAAARHVLRLGCRLSATLHRGTSRQARDATGQAAGGPALAAVAKAAWAPRRPGRSERRRRRRQRRQRAP